MLLDKLESGFLLLHTREGLVSAEPTTFWQRAYLIWTFRNFRELSLPLLNARQTALINDLFREHSAVIGHKYDPGRVIGIVENFAPSSAELGSAESLSDGQRDSFAPMPAWVRSVASAGRSTVSRIRTARATAGEGVATEVAMPRPAVSRIAAAMGSIGLCICFAVAWHRIGAVPGSQAHSAPVEVNTASSSPVPEAVPVAESSVVTMPATDGSVVEAKAETEAKAATEAEAGSGARAETEMKPAPVELASVASVAPAPKPRALAHEAGSTATVAVNGQDSTIQATRPPLRFVYPEYSGANARGVVALTAGVDSKGNVRTVKILNGNRELAAAAVRAVRQWRYRPYVQDGQAVATETNIVISFFSSEAISMTYPPKIPANR